MTTRLDEKPTAKTLIRDALDAQPDDASWEEIMRALALERMVERGLADLRAGRTVSHDEALRSIRSWRT